MQKEWEQMTWNEKCAADPARATKEDEDYYDQQCRRAGRSRRGRSHEQIEGSQDKFV